MSKVCIQTKNITIAFVTLEKNKRDHLKTFMISESGESIGIIDFQTSTLKHQHSSPDLKHYTLIDRETKGDE